MRFKTASRVVAFHLQGAAVAIYLGQCAFLNRYKTEHGPRQRGHEDIKNQMAAITAMVKELREITGLGMMDCKKALVEADGNMEEAIDSLRKSSGLKAAKGGPNCGGRDNRGEVG